MPATKYHRILLKVGGEALAGPQGFGIDPNQGDNLAEIIKSVREHGVEVAIVLGAGNLWRGRDGLLHGMERATAVIASFCETASTHSASSVSASAATIVTPTTRFFSTTTFTKPRERSSITGRSPSQRLNL